MKPEKGFSIKPGYPGHNRIPFISPFICFIILLTILLTSPAKVASEKSLSLRPPLRHDRGHIEYKTTYACDGKMLNLQCKHSESMHLVRANYGRFSLSICNEGGKLDLSVNCMSYRSYLIMQDRCSGKSNCSVIVSSDLFGDPCPGTLKYLEVQYHCVPLGSSTTTRRPPTLTEMIALPVDRPSKPSKPSSSDREMPFSSSSSSSSSSLANHDGNHQHHHHDNKGDGESRRPGHVRHGHGHGTGNRPNQSSLPSSDFSHHHSPIVINVDQQQPTSTLSPILGSVDVDFDMESSIPSNNSPGHHSRPAPSSSSSSHHRPSNLKPITESSKISGDFSPNLDAIVNTFGHHSVLAPSEPPPVPPPPPPPPPSQMPSSPILYQPNSGEPFNQGIAAIGGRFCPPTFRRSLNWNYTALGDTLIQNCPGGAAGMARWHCSEVLGTWMTGGPDMLECRSYWLDNLLDRLERGSSVVDISNNLANMTMGKPVFSRDLETISGLMRQIVDIVRSSKEWEIPRWQPNAFLEELLTSMVYSVSNLLSAAQDDAWLDLSPEKRKRIAFSLIDELEKSALLLAESTNRDGYFTVKRPNVLVAVHVLETNVPISLQFPTVEDTFDTEWIRMEDSLFLPAQSLIEYSHQGFAKAAFLAYNRVEDLLGPSSTSSSSASSSSDRLSKLNNYSTGNSLIVNSRVIGASIGRQSSAPVTSSASSVSASLVANNGLSTSTIPLVQPIIIVFRHLIEENVSRPRCVYWSRDQSEWLSDGCSVSSTNTTHTVCRCNHLSSFALLMEPRPYDGSSETDLNWLRLVVVIASGLSALCLLFIMMILYTIHGDNREVLSIHKDLCLTLLIVQVTFFLGIFQSDNLLPCILSAGVLHYFLVSAFLWTFLESFDHFLNLIDVFETLKATHRLWWYYCLAFGGPALITLLSIFINPHSYGTASYCWLRVDVTLWLTLVGPCILSALAALVFISISAFIVCHNSAISTALKGKEQLKVEDIRCGLKWILLLLFLQIVTWSSAYAYLTNQSSIPLGLSFAIFNILLGLYCIIFCIIRTDSVQHHKIAQHLPLMDWCFDGSDSETATKESVFGPGSTGHHHHSGHGSLYGPSPVIPVVTHVTTQVSPYSDGQIRTFKSSHVITNNTLSLYETIESPTSPTSGTVNPIISPPSSIKSSSHQHQYQQNQLNQQNHQQHQLQQQQQQQQQFQLQNQLCSPITKQNNLITNSFGLYQPTAPSSATLSRSNNHLLLNNSLGLYESIEPPSRGSSPTPYHHTSRNQIYLGHGSLGQHGIHLGSTGRKHRMLVPSDFPV